MKWEVFNPNDGVPVVVTRFKWAAKLIAWMADVDYARQGEGWLENLGLTKPVRLPLPAPRKCLQGNDLGLFLRNYKKH